MTCVLQTPKHMATVCSHKNSDHMTQEVEQYTVFDTTLCVLMLSNPGFQGGLYCMSSSLLFGSNYYVCVLVLIPGSEWPGLHPRAPPAHPSAALWGLCPCELAGSPDQNWTSDQSPLLRSPPPHPPHLHPPPPVESWVALSLRTQKAHQGPCITSAAVLWKERPSRVKETLS